MRRLIFANKIIVSDLSVFQEKLDIKNNVEEEFDNIISTTQNI